MTKNRSLAIVMLLASGCATQPAVEVRAIAAPAESYGVADAEGQLALGNVGLALEGFHNALRDKPDNVRAMVGLASCYDQMNRFDLSRRWYESALAIVPDDASVLAQLAASLDRQGMSGQAAAVRAEIEQNAIAAAQVEKAVLSEESESLQANSSAGALPPSRPFSPAHVAVASEPPIMIRRTPVVAPVIAKVGEAEPAATQPMAPAASVTMRLPAPAPVAQSSAPAAVPPKAVEAKLAAEQQPAFGPRLERLSLGEVALVTRSGPIWTAEAVKQSPQSVTFRWVSAQPVARLLNAARVEGLAARTRSHLADHGWKRLAIGDAPSARAKTLVLYPAFRRGTAARLANQFGFTELRRYDGNEIVVLLGRDAAAMKVLRPA